MYLLFSPSMTFRFVEANMMDEGREWTALWGEDRKARFPAEVMGRSRASMTQRQGKTSSRGHKWSTTSLLGIVWKNEVDARCSSQVP